MPMLPIDTPVVVHLFGRDLRLRDNPALASALASGLPVLPAFVFGRRRYGLNARQESLAYRAIVDMDLRLRARGGGILVGRGEAAEFLGPLLATGRVRAVWASREYDPDAPERARALSAECARHGAEYREADGSTVFAPETVAKPDGGAYAVYTPYARRWREAFASSAPAPGPDLSDSAAWYRGFLPPLPEAASLGVGAPPADVPLGIPAAFDWRGYAGRRDDIADPSGTSGLSVALRLGTVGPRELAALARDESDAFLGELVWREFFTMLLRRFPASAHTEFQTRYRGMPWSRDEDLLRAWSEGATGYPLVDAGMRELAATGRMHNRVRMLAANFAAKLLRLDWRLGEEAFAERLLDYDAALNIGNWQWSAGVGADAAPYFRVFNPQTQREKFDPDAAYVKKWVPECGTSEYVRPVVDYASARAEYLAWWKSATSGLSAS